MSFSAEEAQWEGLAATASLPGQTAWELERLTKEPSLMMLCFQSSGRNYGSFPQPRPFTALFTMHHMTSLGVPLPHGQSFLLAL